MVVSFLEPVITAGENQSSASLCVTKIGRHSFAIEVSVDVCPDQSPPVDPPDLTPASNGTHRAICTPNIDLVFYLQKELAAVCVSA